MLPESKPFSTKLFAKYTYRLPTPRQKEALERFWQGRGFYEVAADMGLKIGDLSTIMTPLYKHWGVKNWREALLIAIQEDYLDLPRKDLF